jgi:hypothetical protein
MNPDDGRSLVLLFDVNVYFEFNGRGRRSSTYRVLLLMNQFLRM